jgi:hypothetical protein
LEDAKPISVDIPATDGKIETRFHIQRTGDVIHIQRQGPPKPWNVLLVGVESVENVENAETQVIDTSTLISLKQKTEELTIQLK